MASSVLVHYGIKGMKWGVRRTPEQLGHYKSSDKKVKNIVDTWSDKDKEFMGLGKDEDYERSPNLVYRSIQYLGKIPVSFLDIEDYGSFYNVSIGTRSGEEYRGRGFATKALRDGVEWWKSHKDEFDKPLSWWARVENEGSNRLAVNAGFDEDFMWRQPDTDPDQWRHYLKR